MAGTDWNSLGNEIRNMVQDAVNSKEFAKLNKDLPVLLTKLSASWETGCARPERPQP